MRSPSTTSGNGIPDLVVSHFSATVVDVLMGNGNGTFQPAVEFPVGSRPYGLALADLDRRRPARHRHLRLPRQRGERALERGRAASSRRR